ncbi:carboxymuconolactone decarboxylase family protein [Methanococcus maripaludis]|uniref:AhpD family alkylhydroperoxidase n=2 Tax=Methanococcus maripaludis TaxID=39152 RepID=A0A7J9PJC0_METMI|nr:carboxymuconolactone decarboxylase family protein [Methanococcus maripaludis]MBA2862828.1 AhpD family alkylhydroperoxidase [Methanococcus maripaludis]
MDENESFSDEKLSELMEIVKKRYGKIPYIIEKMKNNLKLLESKINYDEAVVDDYKHIDPKTAELISIAVVSALGCDHCIEFHIEAAKKMGITEEQIMTAVLIAGSLSNAAVLSKSTRAIQKVNNTLKYNENSISCPECNISGIK